MHITTVEVTNFLHLRRHNGDETAMEKRKTIDLRREEEAEAVHVWTNQVAYLAPNLGAG